MPRTSFRIEPKRDFGDGPGFWLKNAGTSGTDRYGFVKSGFVVTDGFCNIMPAAAWFRTIPEAIAALRILIGCHGHAPTFWREYYLSIDQPAAAAAQSDAL